MLEDISCFGSRDYSMDYERETGCGYTGISVEKGDQNSKRKLDEETGDTMKAPKALCSGMSSPGMSSPVQQSNDGGNQENYDPSSLIDSIGRDNSIDCVVRCSRSDYGVISALNSSFRSLVRTGEVYRLRRDKGLIEFWVYFSCKQVEWEAFDPYRHRWIKLPTMNADYCFECSDKESLAVGTDLLVFGRDCSSYVIYSYTLLTNSWSTGMSMCTPRCLFGSASLGEIAILAGGCDSRGMILESAELYNSESKTWSTLPSMNKPRKMCSAVFMNGKFYVIGGIGGRDGKLLTCGEEYDLDAKTWTVIPNMSPVARDSETPTSEAPPLVAVVNNELYAAEYADSSVRKYSKHTRVWSIVGRLPERARSMNGWGMAFRACGNMIFVISGPRTHAQGFIEVYSWVPNEGPIQWNLLGRKQSGSFVYNCAVMGC